MHLLGIHGVTRTSNLPPWTTQTVPTNEPIWLNNNYLTLLLAGVSKTTSRHTSSSKPVGESDKDYRQQQKDYSDRDYRNKPASSDHHDYKDVDYRSASSSKTSQNKNNIRRSVSTERDYRAQHSSNSANAINNHSNASSSSNVQENYLPSTGKFYDYSSWNTTTSSNESKTINGITVAKPNDAFLKTEGKGSTL